MARAVQVLLDHLMKKQAEHVNDACEKKIRTSIESSWAEEELDLADELIEYLNSHSLI